MDCIIGAHESDMHTPNQRSELFCGCRWIVLTIFQMHDSNGVPILALPPVSDLKMVLRERISKQ